MYHFAKIGKYGDNLYDVKWFLCCIGTALSFKAIYPLIDCQADKTSSRLVADNVSFCFKASETLFQPD